METTTTSKSLLLIKWGIIGGLLSFLVSVVTQYSGLAEDFSETLGWVSFLVTFVINVTVLFLALKEVREQQGGFLTYGEGFAMGYGKYEKVQYKHYVWDVAVTCNINPKTIRHIVGIPNHVRAWRRETYFAIGGHNRELSIADDYELIIRTFLHTKMVKIPKLGYIQFLHFKGDEQNSHDIARADIQRRVRTIMEHYNEQIAKRFEELGVKDWVFESKNLYPWEVSSRYGDEEGYVNEIFLG